MTNRLLALSAWLVVIVIIVATLSPIGLRPHVGSSANLERFIAFSAAGFLLGSAYPRYFFYVVLFIIVLAAGLETLQHLTPDRHGHFGDMTVKAAGGLAGAFVAGLILKFKPDK